MKRNWARLSPLWMAFLWMTTGILGAGSSGCKARVPNLMSKSQEIELGREAQAQINQEYRGKLVTSGPQYERLQRIARRIFPQAQKDFDVPYSIALIDDKQVNAFAVPGGPIYFYTGLINLASSDDEIASVLGHEAAHISQRHSAQQISDAQGKGLLAQILLDATNAGQLGGIAANIGLQLQQLSFSRDDESEADAVGFDYMTQAGYDPDAMASFFRKMQQAAGGRGGPEWLSSHPLTGKRVEAAEERAREYKQNRNVGN